MRRATVRIISVMLTVVMAVAFCSCSFNAKLSDIVKGDSMPAPEIARLVVSAVTSEANLNDSYTGIPENQQGGVSFSYYKAYIDVLRRLSKQNGTITSFKVLTDSELEELLSGYAAMAEVDYSIWNERYGDLVAVEFLYERESEYPVYLFLEESSSGVVSLSSSWINDVLNVYNYAEHYFTMLDEQNTEGVYTLIRPGYTSDVYSDASVYAKAERLISFYRHDVHSVQSQFDFISLTPMRFDISIPNTNDVITEDTVSHELSIRVDENSNLYVEDSLLQPLDENVITVFYGDENILILGSTYSNSFLCNTVGKPYSEGLRNIDGNERMLVIYSGLTLFFELDDEYEDSDNWSGTLVSVRLSGDTYSLGNGITVGITVNDLLINYPFLDEMNYDIHYDDGNHNYHYSFVTDDEGVITRIVAS